MTAEVLAWVAAAAAVVQAGGSIAAIIWAVRIAHAAEARATKVERAALQREEAARAASAAREEAVQKAADDRVRRAEADHHNGVIDIADELLQSALNELQTSIESFQTDTRRAMQTNVGKFESVHIRNLKKIIPELKLKSRDIKIMAGLSKLDIDIDQIINSSNYSAPGPKVATILRDTERKFTAARRELDGLRT